MNVFTGYAQATPVPMPLAVREIGTEGESRTHRQQILSLLALPISIQPQNLVGVVGIEPTLPEGTGLQSALDPYESTHPIWYDTPDSNRERPGV